MLIAEYFQLLKLFYRVYKSVFIDPQNLTKKRLQMKSDDSQPTLNLKTINDKKSIDSTINKRFSNERIKDDNSNFNFTKTCLNPDFVPLLDNPSIAELSQRTALKMMQNFEEFAKLDKFVGFFFFLNNFIK